MTTRMGISPIYIRVLMDALETHGRASHNHQLKELVRNQTSQAWHRFALVELTKENKDLLTNKFSSLTLQISPEQGGATLGWSGYAKD